MESALSTWLDPLQRVLDAAETPVVFFFRDDDAGWEDERLFTLLDLHQTHGMPIDLAVIPQTLSPKLADSLLTRRAKGKSAVGLHAHGYTHANHETTGRKCEFGASRSAIQQLDDISVGLRKLKELLGSNVEPIFTPPWNRCVQVTAQCLCILEFATLSRIRGSAPLQIDRLNELDVAVDWQKKIAGARIGQQQLGAWLAQAAMEPLPLGVMLHHAVMDVNDLRMLAELLVVLECHPNAGCVPMRELSATRMPSQSNGKDGYRASNELCC